jgi:hypothetical protein
MVTHAPEPGAPALGSAAGFALAALVAATRRSRRVSAGEAAGQALERAGRRVRVAVFGRRA